MSTNIFSFALVGIAKKNRGVISSTDEELLVGMLTKESPMC